MVKVVIESPYAGDVEKNLSYAKMCLKDSLKRGEAPIASHLLYTQVLDDNLPSERMWGIEAGLAWLELADLHVFYIDLGMSAGMDFAMTESLRLGKVIETRKIL